MSKEELANTISLSIPWGLGLGYNTYLTCATILESNNAEMNRAVYLRLYLFNTLLYGTLSCSLLEIVYDGLCPVIEAACLLSKTFPFDFYGFMLRLDLNHLVAKVCQCLSMAFLSRIKDCKLEWEREREHKRKSRQPLDGVALLSECVFSPYCSPMNLGTRVSCVQKKTENLLD